MSKVEKRLLQHTTCLTISGTHFCHASDSQSIVSPILTALSITLQLLLKEAAHLQSARKRCTLSAFLTS